MSMSDLVKKCLARPAAGEIIAEFARHVKRNTEPAIFAAAYLELLRSTDDNIRQDATGVLLFAASRTWEEMRELILGKVNEDVRDVLGMPETKVFYDKWLRMVKEQVKKYYDDFLEGQE